MLQTIEWFTLPCLLCWPDGHMPQTRRLFRDALAGYLLVFWVLQGLLIDPVTGLLAAMVEVLLILAFTCLLVILGQNLWPVGLVASLLLGSTAVVGLLAIPVLAWLLVAESGQRLLACGHAALVYLGSLSLIS